MDLFSAISGYLEPPPRIKEIFDAPPSPLLHFREYTDIALEFTYQDYMTLEQLAEPSLELAGEKISRRLNASITWYPKTSLKIHFLKENRILQPELPAGIKIRDYRFSHDNRSLAFSHESTKGLELAIIEIDSGKVMNLENLLINDIFADGGFWWLADGKTLLLKVIPAGRAEEPRKPAVPAGPVIEETSGKFSTERTYQNLLQNEHDELLFDYYFTSQLCLFNLETRQIRFLGKPAIYDKVIFSPDNKYLLVEIINRPYSYAVPHYRFPRSFEIWDSNGNKLKTIYQRPLQDEIPIGGTYQGPRYFQWQPIQDAILVWVEALDEGDPKKKVEHRDRIMRLSAPFSDQPEELFRITHRYSSLYWSQQKDELIYSEYDRDLLWTRHWLYRIGADKPSLLFDLSINNRYDHPGGIISRFTARGEEVFIKEGDWVFYNNVMGATPQGNYPHLSRINLRNGRKETLFTSRENFYEKAICFTDTLLTEITFQSENNNSPRNYFLKNLSTGRTIRITDFPHPYPEISGIPINIEKYTRKDGVPLSGTLYLPPDYKPGQRLPLIFHAYPEEYTDVTTAGQVKSSPFQFTRFRGASVKFLVLAGYAVLANASIPIIGEPETVNENFIEQLLASVQAAVDHLDSEGIIDPERVGIMGHSYGAFMVANVLAHSDICKTGVALSGAYNRTLTPYGFQSERRTLWQARDFYIKVSPFLFADNIKNPLLLIHGQDDPNAGTFPMQSQRMFQALKGQGATARLVLLPLEGHGYRARESNLHVLAEIINWFDKYLKNVTSK